MFHPSGSLYPAKMVFLSLLQIRQVPFLPGYPFSYLNKKSDACYPGAEVEDTVPCGDGLSETRDPKVSP